MVDIIATTICDSISEHSPRLHTQRWRHPKFNHQEALRHRKIYIHDNLALTYDPDFSFSVSSSRAIPFAKMLAEVSDPALMSMPVYWGEAQKGMSPGKELDNVEKCIFWPEVVAMFAGSGAQITAVAEWITKRECAKRLWIEDSQHSAMLASIMVDYTDIHKSVPNRMVEKGIHVNCLATGTEPGWMNFFGLRLDGAADPTLRALAEQSWISWNESEPVLIGHGQWHMPYANDNLSLEEVINYHSYRGELLFDNPNGANLLKTLSTIVSPARCAHLSFEALDTGERLSVERCLDICKRLSGIPLHASPFEHQATPDTYDFNPDLGWIWEEPHLAGNLGPGWIQLRKTLPNEAVAPIPEAYRGHS